MPRETEDNRGKRKSRLLGIITRYLERPYGPEVPQRSPYIDDETAEKLRQIAQRPGGRQQISDLLSSLVINKMDHKEPPDR